MNYDRNRSLSSCYHIHLNCFLTENSISNLIGATTKTAAQHVMRSDISNIYKYATIFIIFFSQVMCSNSSVQNFILSKYMVQWYIVPSRYCIVLTSFHFSCGTTQTTSKHNVRSIGAHAVYTLHFNGKHCTNIEKLSIQYTLYSKLSM